MGPLMNGYMNHDKEGTGIGHEPHDVMNAQRKREAQVIGNG